MSNLHPHPLRSAQAAIAQQRQAAEQIKLATRAAIDQQRAAVQEAIQISKAELAEQIAASLQEAQAAQQVSPSEEELDLSAIEIVAIEATDSLEIADAIKIGITQEVEGFHRSLPDLRSDLQQQAEKIRAELAHENQRIQASVVVVHTALQQTAHQKQIEVLEVTQQQLNSENNPSE